MARDIRHFDIQVAKFAKKLNLAVVTLQRMVALKVFTKLVQGNPVDTGRARASWTVNVNRPNRAVKPPKPSGTVAYPEPPFPEVQVKLGETIWISNSLPYIFSLEQGHSGQAPNGWIRVSVEEVRQELRGLERAAAKATGL